MTWLAAKALLWVALGAVLVVAGVHWVYYLVNWEWNRAAIAGTGFVAAGVIMSTVLVLGRLRRVEQRLDLLLADRGAAHGDGRRPVADPEPRPDFPWLVGYSPAVALVAIGPWAPPAQEVFIPIFLAAGLGLSAAAGVVERVAARRYEHSTSGGAAGAPPSAREVLRSTPRRLLVAVSLGSVLVVAALVSGLWFGGHYWAKPVGPGVTSMTVVVESRDEGGRSPSAVLESAGRYCAADSGTGAEYLGVGPADGGLELRLAPLLDEEARGRFIGCLEDGILERHRLTVTGTSLLPRHSGK